MNVHRAISLSNASFDLHPKNSASNFTHHLPVPIVLDSTLQHSVYLQSLIVSPKLSKSAKVGYLKVHLNEINPQASTKNGNERCLAVFPFPKRHTLPTFWYEFDHPIHVPLDNLDVIKEFNFWITDEDNNIVKFSRCCPTVLNLVVEEMKFQDHFSLSLNPFDSKDIFTTNNNNDFSSSLPNTIELGEGWEVALHSVMVPKGLFIDSNFEIKLTSGWSTVSPQKWIDKGQSLKSILRQLKAHLSGWNMSLIINEKTGVSISTGEGSSAIGGSLWFNDAVCRSVGIPSEGGRTWRIQEDITELSSVSPSTLATRSVNHLAVYCDVVTNSIMGNVFSQILDIIPCEESGLTDKTVDTFYPLRHLTFRPVLHSGFSSIRVQLSTIDGANIHWITLNLLFRKHHE